MPLSNQEMINKVRSAVALLLEESFGSKDSTSLPTLCISVEASLIDLLKCFISATLEYGAPQMDSQVIHTNLTEVFFLDDVYSIRIVEDMFNPALMNILIFSSGDEQPLLIEPIKKKIRGNGRFAGLAIYTSSQLERFASLFAVLAKTTFEAGYSWLEDRVHEFLGDLHRPKQATKSLSEDMGRVIRTLVGEALADRIWFMVSVGESSMLAMDSRKRWHSMNIFARGRHKHGRSPLEQIVALTTTVLPFDQTLTYKAFQEDGSLRSKFVDAPYARPATPFMHALRTAFESEVAYVNVITPDSELIVALGCPDSLKGEVKKSLSDIRKGIQRVIRNRAPDFKESLRIATSHSTTASLRTEAAEIANTLICSVQMDPKLVFISYCHADELHKNNIEKHLSPLVRERQIKIVTDRGIKPGSKWESEIAEYLSKSTIVLLLISADFIASDYCYEKELSNAIQRNDRGEAIVIPVFLRPCHYRNLAFSQIQGVPKDAVPIEKLQYPEDGYVQVVKAVQDALSGNESS
ncbi:MAG: hypothetical protein QOE33_1588 [Acidobacteriota bacterium]|nr:hypothetical protein [Acidobacteriota bacterium]